MSGGYSPKTTMPWLSNNIPQMRSEGFQKPFYFGGAQEPISLGLPPNSFSGSGFSKSVPSMKGIKERIVYTGKTKRRAILPTMKK